MLCLTELFRIVNAGYRSRSGATLSQVVELGDVGVQSEILTLLERSTRTQLVENVIVSLSLRLIYKARPLQEICANSGANDLLGTVEENLEKVLNKRNLNAQDRTYLDIFTET